jgi:hypothetical protein
MSRRVWLAPALLLGAIAAIGGCSSNDSGCKTDNDCKGDRICESGECVSPNGSSGGSSGGSGGSGGSSAFGGTGPTGGTGGGSGGAAGCADECKTSAGTCCLPSICPTVPPCIGNPCC